MQKLSCTRVKICFFYLIAALILVPTVRAQDESRYDKIVQYYVASQNFMGTVIVARDNDILFSKGFGSANLEWDIPNSPATKFRLGSITKQFTAASILLLEERGKLKIDDPIKKYLPDAPDAWDKITIFNLLTHTSGIPNYTSFSETQKEQFTAHTPKQIVDIFRDRPLEFIPGERMSYSNSGYILLGYLLEKVSGETYQDFLQKNIFDPLGMKDSGYDSNSSIIPKRASGYSPGPGGQKNADYVHMSMPFSAGALYSTTEDLLRWEQGLFDGKLLSKESLSKMITPYKNGYALGVGTGDVNGHKVIQHGGGIQGFNTQLAYYPDDKLTVAVLSNVNGTTPAQLAIKLGAVARGEEVLLPSERKEITVPAEILPQYVGTYELRPGFNIMITLEGNQLMSQASGQGKAPIFPESETKFFYKVVDAVIEFFKDESGKVTHLILYQNGTDNKAVKTSDTVLERKEIALSNDILSQYVGTYELQPGFDLVITLEGDQLISQATGQGKVPIFAETETKFFPKVIDATIEFFKDDKGAVSHLILSQGGRETVARRDGYEKEPDPVDGTWTGTADGPDGKPIEVTYVFEALGKALLGTVNTSLGGGPFSEGKIDGNKISFAVRIDPSTTIETTGTLSGDMINIIQRNGDNVTEFTVERVSK
jgi:CubicO group peptidase (beta-lactamase class C family)